MFTGIVRELGVVISAQEAGGGRALTVWVPLGAYPLLQKRTPAAFSSRDTLFLNAAARLRPGISTEAASTIVAGLAERGRMRAARPAGVSAGAGEAADAYGSAVIKDEIVQRFRPTQRRFCESIVYARRDIHSGRC